MLVFVSHAREDGDAAEAIALAVRAAGHDVFFDRDPVALPPGEEYDARIRRAIERADLFVFCLSPAAIDAGSYTLTEIEIATGRWAHPGGRVLPVMLRPTPLDAVPPYLRAVTILQPAGNVPASVAEAVSQLAGRVRRRRYLWASGAGGIVLAAALATLVVVGPLRPGPAPPPELPREITGRDGAPMVLVPAGPFSMGHDAWPTTRPVHTVHVSAFYIDRYEVTIARFLPFLEHLGKRRGWDESFARHGATPDLPAFGVNWATADAYCRWIGKRLPTEAEWEKAARGVDGRRYPWGDDPPTPARATYKGAARFSPPGRFEEGRSPYGVYDMAGNVTEWVADWVDEQYYARSPRADPKGPEQGQYKISRGGSIEDDADFLQTFSRRTGSPPNDSYWIHGVRCASDPPASPDRKAP
jgi:formylglycine-generating enzyme required for sulfatase activity